MAFVGNSQRTAQDALDELFVAIELALPPGISKADVRRVRAKYGPGMAVELERLLLRHKLTSERMLPTPEGLSLYLRAVPNLDFSPGTHQATVEVPGRWHSVASVADAIWSALDFIRAWQLGGGNWSGGELAESGKVFARISYNGRLWDAATDKEIILILPPPDKSKPDVKKARKRPVAELEKHSAEFDAAGLKGVAGLTETEQLRLLQIFRNSVNHDAEADSDPIVRRSKALSKMASIERALLRQQTTFVNHEPGQSGYSDTTSVPTRPPIRRWFRENAEALAAIAEEALVPKSEGQAIPTRLQIKLVRDMAPAIKGQTMLPKGSLWDVETEARSGSFFYGWEIRPPGQGIHVIPQNDAVPFTSVFSGAKAKAHLDYKFWKIFSDESGELWSVQGKNSLSSSDMKSLHAKVDDYILRQK